MRKIIATSVTVLLLSGVAANMVYAQLTNDKSANKPATPQATPPQTPQQFKSDVDKIVKDNQQSLNSEMQQIQKQGPGALLPPEMMQSPAAPSEPNTASTNPPAQMPPPAMPPKSKPSMAAPAVETPAAPATQAAPATSQPYSGFGGSSTPSQNNSNNGNTKSGGWNMGY